MESVFLGSVFKHTLPKLSILHPTKLPSFRNGEQVSYNFPVTRHQHQPLMCQAQRIEKLHGKRNYFQNAIPTINSANEFEPQDSHSKSPLRSTLDFIKIVIKFTKPYTVIGTVLVQISYALDFVTTRSDFSPWFFRRLLENVVASILINIYISGYNQLFDVDIDKVNKPHYPLASGELSVAAGSLIVSLAIIANFVFAWAVGSRPLLQTVAWWFFLGTAYSIKLPLLRWKRFSVMTAFVMFGLRAGSFYLSIKTFSPGGMGSLSKPQMFAFGISAVFAIVQALFKDIPDIEGDQKYGIRTLAARIGPKKMFWSCIWLLEIGFIVAIMIGLSSTYLWSRYITVLGHAAMGCLLLLRAQKVSLNNVPEVESLHKFIWQLDYMEAILSPLVR